VSQTVSLRRLSLRRKGSKDNTSAAVSTSYRIQAYAILVAWLVLIVIFTLLQPDIFPTWQNVTSIANQKAATVLLTLGLVFALSAGEFDLSIGGAVSLGAAIPAWLATVHGYSLPVAILIALVFAAIFGFINGLLSVKAKIPSLVVTLGTGTALLGIVSGVAGNTTMSVQGDPFALLVKDRVLGFYVAFWVMLIIAMIVWYILEHTPVGRQLYFVGQGREVARLAGIRTNAYRYCSLILCSTLAALAGAMILATSGSAQSGIGESYILPAFAAAFLGSTAIRPGRFNVWGTVVAVYFLETGITGLQFMGFENWIQDVFYGLALVIGVLVATLASNLRSRSSD
jgi:ribose transport system permease protein